MIRRGLCLSSQNDGKNKEQKKTKQVKTSFWRLTLTTYGPIIHRTMHIHTVWDWILSIYLESIWTRARNDDWWTVHLDECCPISNTVKNLRHVLWPPIDHDTPLFSVITCNMLVARAPLPAVNESPIAPITSMSPGRSRCTEVGVCWLRAPGPFGSQKKAAVSGNGFWTFCRRESTNSKINQFQQILHKFYKLHRIVANHKTRDVFSLGFTPFISNKSVFCYRSTISVQI